MDNVPAGQEVAAGPMSVYIEELADPALKAQVPPCPDWPDLN
jgi:hypothetical protein